MNTEETRRQPHEPQSRADTSELGSVEIDAEDTSPPIVADDDEDPWEVVSVSRKRRCLLRSPSLELLNPSHDSEKRKSSLFAATFNMVATIVGGKSCADFCCPRSRVSESYQTF